MNWISAIIIIAVFIVLLAILYYQIKEAKRKPQDKRCITCRKKILDSWHDVRCMNKKSKFFGLTMDDDTHCNKWKG